MGTLEFVVLFGLINSLAALGIDALLPAMRVLEGAMNVTEPNRIQLVVSMFILGAVFGELVAGPLADAYGRKIIVLSGLGIFFAGSIVSMMAVDLDQLLLGRIIQGFGVSGPKIASRAMIRDQFSGDAMARIMSFIFMVFILVPMIAPAIGQWAMNIAGWEAIFIMYLIMAGIGFLWLSIRQGETLLPETRLPLSASTIFRNVGLIIQNKRVMAYTISVGFVFGGIINYLGIAQALFFDIYGIDQQFPLYFAMLAGGIGLSLFANSQLVMHFDSCATGLDCSQFGFICRDIHYRAGTVSLHIYGMRYGHVFLLRVFIRKSKFDGNEQSGPCGRAWSLGGHIFFQHNFRWNSLCFRAVL